MGPKQTREWANKENRNHEVSKHAKIISDVYFIEENKSRTHSWKSLVGLSPNSLNARAATDFGVLSRFASPLSASTSSP